MRNNIRRSLMVAAAASGIWALSTAGASAAELPVPSDAGSAVGGTVENAEKAGEDGRGTVADTVRRATDTAKETTGTVEDVTGEVREELPTNGIPENGLPTNTLPTNTLPTNSQPTGGLPTGAADTLPASPLRPEQLTGELEGRHAEEAVGKVRNTVAHAHPVIDNVSGTVPAARPVGLHARATAYQLTVDAARTVDCALATTAPFAESTYHRTEALGHDATGDLGTFAHGAASDSAAYAHALAGTGVHGNVDKLAAHTVRNAWSLVTAPTKRDTAPTKRDLTDPASIPGAPVTSQMPAGL